MLTASFMGNIAANLTNLQQKRDGNAAPVEDVITERDEEHRVHHGDPYWCGAPFCGSKEKRDDNAAPVEDVIIERDEDKKPHKSKIFWDPYWCGAPFCPKPKVSLSSPINLM